LAPDHDEAVWQTEEEDDAEVGRQGPDGRLPFFPDLLQEESGFSVFRRQKFWNNPIQ
jgi:hypothetical protein